MPRNKNEIISDISIVNNDISDSEKMINVLRQEILLPLLNELKLVEEEEYKELLSKIEKDPEDDYDLCVKRLEEFQKMSSLHIKLSHRERTYPLDIIDIIGSNHFDANDDIDILEMFIQYVFPKSIGLEKYKKEEATKLAVETAHNIIKNKITLVKRGYDFMNRSHFSYF